MEVQDFNHSCEPAVGAPPVSPGALPQPGADHGATRNTDGSERQRTEVIFLKKRIEHLELVVETARSLMTSNQERLLRRLHDLPHELMALTTALNRLDQHSAARNDLAASQTGQTVPAQTAQARKVA